MRKIVLTPEFEWSLTLCFPVQNFILLSLCCIERQSWMVDNSITALNISRLWVCVSPGMCNFIIFVSGLWNLIAIDLCSIKPLSFAVSLSLLPSAVSRCIRLNFILSFHLSISRGHGASSMLGCSRIKPGHSDLSFFPTLFLFPRPSHNNVRIMTYLALIRLSRMTSGWFRGIIDVQWWQTTCFPAALQNAAMRLHFKTIFGDGITEILQLIIISCETWSSVSPGNVIAGRHSSLESNHRRKHFLSTYAVVVAIQHFGYFTFETWSVPRRGRGSAWTWWPMVSENAA